MAKFCASKKARIRKYPEIGPSGPKTVIFELPESIEKPVLEDDPDSGERIENWLFSALKNLNFPPFFSKNFFEKNYFETYI